MDTKKKLAALGLTAGLIGGGAAGAILGSAGVSGATTVAATQDDTTTTTPDAGAPDADGDAERGPGRFLEDALAPLVDDGTITQEQADEVVAAIRAARPEGRGPGRGHGMMVGGLSAAAGVLGVQEEDLLTLLRNGATLAEVAEQKGVDPQAVIDALVAQVEEHLDEEVASGERTQEEADERLAAATERITEMVNEGGPMHGPRGGSDAADDDAEGN
jgi:hypothetical protein